MNVIFHPAQERLYANHGWLVSHHTFSFANLYDPEKIRFGLLRVLNDDLVKAGQGFGKHPHDNMEIITIPLSGALEHRDNTGGHYIIKYGDVQIMSAGKGIIHSEVNASDLDPVTLLQIWIYPKVKNIEPRYQQKTLNVLERENQWQIVVAPNEGDNHLVINQDAWFSMTKLVAGNSLVYSPKHEGNGQYIFVISGSVSVGSFLLNDRDGLGIILTSPQEFVAQRDSEILVMDLPMG